MKISKSLKRRNFTKLLVWSLTVFLILAVAYGAFGYASGSVPYYVVSDRPSSMSPTINFGGFVLTYKPSFDSLKVGDIIVFHYPFGGQSFVVHRVVGIVQDCPVSGSYCLATKGDNNATNPSIDPWNVTEQMYVGKIVLVVPYVGYFLPSLWPADGIFAYAPMAMVALAAILFSFAFEGRKGMARNPDRPVSKEGESDLEE